MTDEFDDDERQRESELADPKCRLCGHAIWWPWDAGDPVRCEYCGAENFPRFPLHIAEREA